MTADLASTGGMPASPPPRSARASRSAVRSAPSSSARWPPARPRTTCTAVPRRMPPSLLESYTAAFLGSAILFAGGALTSVLLLRHGALGQGTAEGADR